CSVARSSHFCSRRHLLDFACCHPAPFVANCFEYRHCPFVDLFVGPVRSPTAPVPPPSSCSPPRSVDRGFPVVPLFSAAQRPSFRFLARGFAFLPGESLDPRVSPRALLNLGPVCGAPVFVLSVRPNREGAGEPAAIEHPAPPETPGHA